MHDIAIGPLDDTPAVRAMLADMLIETVALGGSVSFMHPLSRASAEAFWDAALKAAAQGNRVLLGAWDCDAIVGTVTLHLDSPPNQPHRSDIAKMMTRGSHRGRGIASALMQAAEVEAVARRRTLLTLDTATIGGASGLYEKLGFRFAGEIPDYALLPQGGFTGTRLYWKTIGSGEASELRRS